MIVGYNAVVVDVYGTELCVAFYLRQFVIYLLMKLRIVGV